MTWPARSGSVSPATSSRAWSISAAVGPHPVSTGSGSTVPVAASARSADGRGASVQPGQHQRGHREAGAPAAREGRHRPSLPRIGRLRGQTEMRSSTAEPGGYVDRAGHHLHTRLPGQHHLAVGRAGPGVVGEVHQHAERAPGRVEPPVGPGDVDPVEPGVAQVGLRPGAAPIRSRYQASSRACGSAAGSDQSSLERRNVSGSCGSGTSRSSQPCEPNSALRPRRGGLGDLGVGVVGEELPRRAGAPLLAHEQHRRPRRGQQDRGAAGEQAGSSSEHREPVALRAVADLVVGLQRRHEPPAGDGRGVDGPAVPPAAEASSRCRRGRTAMRSILASAAGSAKSA